VLRHRDLFSILIDYADRGQRTTALLIDFLNLVSDRNCVSDEHGAQVADVIITDGDGALFRVRYGSFLQHSGRGRGHVADKQRTMGNAPLILGTAHELLVDVIRRKIASDARKQIDIGFADGTPVQTST
jgi:hypothetical protein